MRRLSRTHYPPNRRRGTAPVVAEKPKPEPKPEPKTKPKPKAKNGAGKAPKDGLYA